MYLFKSQQKLEKRGITMKKILLITFIISAFMLLLPLGAVTTSSKSIQATTIKTDEIKTSITQSTSFKVLDTATNTITEMTAKDYIFGVVAAEMPALYETEALKAQAVAAYTFACCRKVENSEKEYDITNDHTTDQSFITEEQARIRWGDKANEYINKIKGAVEDTADYMITYNGKPITAVYHAISSGKTESSKDIWNFELEYLTAVSSEGDKLATNYISEASFTAEELKQKLSDSVEFSGEPKDFFTNITRTDSGSVKSIMVCSQELTGSKLREKLELRSSNFSVNFADDKFTFTVYGYGHGVGMRQNGANFIAKQGSNFKEILRHYYKSCKIEKIKN